MRYKIISLLIAMLMITSLFGCAPDNMDEEGMDPEANLESGYRKTVLYYANEDGLVVPIMKQIPWEEGIGKAALSHLVSNYENDLSASKMGLYTVIPEGAEISLRIGDDGLATVTLSNMPSMEEGKIKTMVTAIVNTLTEFSSINMVTIKSDGKNIVRETKRLVLNVEDTEIQVSSENAHKMTLYFPNASASLNIPVTRYVEEAPSFALAVQALIDGPQDESLRCCFPEGTELNAAEIEGNKAMVDLTTEFLNAADVDGLLNACYDTLCLTAGEFAVVYELELRVNGEVYDFNTVEVSVPLYVNEFR